MATFGIKTVQNSLHAQEDAFAAHIDLACSVTPAWAQRLAYFGVFDGHGGNEASQHCASNLHRHFVDLLKRTDLADRLHTAESLSSENSLSHASAVSETLQQWPLDSRSDRPDSDMELDAGSETLSVAAFPMHAVAPLSDKYSSSIKSALRNAFLQTDADLAGTEVGDLVGSTAVVAVVACNEVFVAHCGDSRAVLCRKGIALPLTSDHKPHRSDELARVSSLGGKVIYKGGSHRVMGLLAMSRAIGDHFLRPYIVPEPEVMSFQRSHEDELLLLASDGLWDVFSAQEATTLALRSMMRARHRGASASAACRISASVLARGAIERGSKDNITVIVVDLKRTEAAAGSVAAVLASQCSEVPHPRRKRSSSGADDYCNSSSSGAAGGGSASCQGTSPSSGSSSQDTAAAGTAAPAAGRGSSSSGSLAGWRNLGISSVNNGIGLLLSSADPPRQSYFESLASAWAAASAAFSGAKDSSSNTSNSSSVLPQEGFPAAAGLSGSNSSTGGATIMGNEGNNMQQRQQQAEQPRLLQIMHSAPLHRSSRSGATMAGAEGSTALTAAPAAALAAANAACPLAATESFSSCSLRTQSFTKIELGHKGRHLAGPWQGYGGSGSCKGSAQQQQVSQQPQPQGQPSRCVGVGKPPLPPQHHTIH